MPYAIVTGATQGIGKAIAEKLMSEGFSVSVCARSRKDLHDLENEWKVKYPAVEILACCADLSVKQEVLSFARQTLEKFPVIDVLVNNAGLFFPGELSDEPEGHMETLMNVNFFSAYHLTRQIVPVMKKRKSGHIFNMCSVASLRAYSNGGAYSVTKYALLGFSENLRHELIPHKIKVTAISPGATNSRSWQGANLPEGRIMEPTDVASMFWAAYTLSAAADVEHIVMRPQQGDI